MARGTSEIDQLIQEGLSLYGEGDLDGALLLWDRVLVMDPENAQANSYVDYVRMNYELLTSDDDTDDSEPFTLKISAEETGAEEPRTATLTPAYPSAEAQAVTSEGPSTSPPLRVFLCHSSGDKPATRELYSRLKAHRINPWLDEEDLLPGQDWEMEIPRAVRNSDVVIVCLSRASVAKTGYVQKEIKYALDVADEQPEGAIFIIPLRLEECDVPARLQRWHWVNLFEERGYEKLLRALQARATQKLLPPKHR